VKEWNVMVKHLPYFNGMTEVYGRKWNGEVSVM
jgi:hypothetical protein